MSKFKSTSMKILLVIIAILIIVFSFFYWGTYSEGTRSGVVIKLSKKGSIFKTYEGQLNLEGFGAIKDPNSFSQVWSFSVETGHEDVVQALRDASLTGERVELSYIQRYWRVPWRGDTDYFVREVRKASDVGK